MKRFIPHILIAVILLAGTGLFLTSDRSNEKFEERLSFRRRDKIPYGMYVAYEQLKNFFPNAAISTEKREPGMWDNLSAFDDGQALIIISPQFMPDESEMKRLIQFVERGNDVFVSTLVMSRDARKMLNCEMSSTNAIVGSTVGGRDTVLVSLTPHPAGETGEYGYPGRSLEAWFTDIDTNTTHVMGYNEYGSPNFIRLSAGNGNLYIHGAPLSFSNYFLLHRTNIGYYENAFSFLEHDKKKIAWDEYYIYRQQNRDTKRSSWMSAFMSEKGFRWGFLVAILALVLYALMEIRRKQRIIPVITKPKNDSLDFVKTIGRLYHDKGDHYNLCRKMSAYFLEHIRSRYKLNTTELNETFIQDLQYKSGVDEAEIRPIVTFIQQLDTVDQVSPNQLTVFHHKLETFYKKA